MKKNFLEIIKEKSEKLLGLLGVEGQINLSEDKENQAIKVQIQTPDPGVLIGYHGWGLEALQLILAVIVNRQQKEWRRIIVDVGDYRQRREEALKRIALAAAERAHFSGEPVTLSSFSAAERRIIHLALADHPEVETYSEGEDQTRRLIVKPRRMGQTQK